MKTIKEIIKEQDEKFYDFFHSFDCKFSMLDAPDIIFHIQTRDTAILEGVVEMMNELETQKFLDKKCQVGDFVKLDDVLSTLKRV